MLIIIKTMQVRTEERIKEKKMWHGTKHTLWIIKTKISILIGKRCKRRILKH